MPQQLIDPRSRMTDRKKYMVRTLHTVKIVVLVAKKLAAEKRVTSATASVRNACRFLKLPADYNPQTDPTMRACVKQMKKYLATR